MGNSSVVFDILKGSFLTSRNAGRNWRMILFVVFLLMIMVWSAHRADEKVVLIANLNREKRALKAEYITVKNNLSTMKLESSVREKVVSDGIFFGDLPPAKIKVKIKK